MDGVVISESSGMYRSFSFDAEGPVSRGRKSPPSPRYRKSADFSSPEKAFHGNGAEMSPSDENIFDTLSRNRKQALEAAEKMLKGKDYSPSSSHHHYTSAANKSCYFDFIFRDIFKTTIV